MSTKEKEPPLALDMDFGEALSRFAQVDPNEIKGDKRLEGKRKLIPNRKKENRA